MRDFFRSSGGVKFGGNEVRGGDAEFCPRFFISCLLYAVPTIVKMKLCVGESGVYKSCENAGSR